MINFTGIVLGFFLVGVPTGEMLLAQTSVARVTEGTVFRKPAGAPDSAYTRASSIYAGDLIKVLSTSSDAVIVCTANQLEQIIPNDGVPRAISSLCPS